MTGTITEHQALKNASLFALSNEARILQAQIDSAAAASRRYWREVHHAALLQGWSWPEAEALGVEP